jgi:hypothetical protein
MPLNAQETEPNPNVAAHKVRTMETDTVRAASFHEVSVAPPGYSPDRNHAYVSDDNKDLLLIQPLTDEAGNRDQLW